MTQRRPGTKPFCHDCLEDSSIDYPRDPDAECLICGLQLCAAHISQHLSTIHFCALTLSHGSRTAPEPTEKKT